MITNAYKCNMLVWTNRNVDYSIVIILDAAETFKRAQLSELHRIAIMNGGVCCRNWTYVRPIPQPFKKSRTVLHTGKSALGICSGLKAFKVSYGSFNALTWK